MSSSPPHHSQDFANNQGSSNDDNIYLMSSPAFPDLNFQLQNLDTYIDSDSAGKNYTTAGNGIDPNNSSNYNTTATNNAHGSYSDSSFNDNGMNQSNDRELINDVPTVTSSQLGSSDENTLGETQIQPQNLNHQYQPADCQPNEKGDEDSDAELTELVPVSLNTNSGLQYPSTSLQHINPTLTESKTSSSIDSHFTSSKSTTSISSNLFQTPSKPLQNLTSFASSNNIPSLQSPVRNAYPIRSSTINPYTHRRSLSKVGLENSPLSYQTSSLLSPKVKKKSHRKNISISSTSALTHLETDLQLQSSNIQSFHASPTDLPLRTPESLVNHGYYIPEHEDYADKVNTTEGNQYEDTTLQDNFDTRYLDDNNVGINLSFDNDLLSNAHSNFIGSELNRSGNSEILNVPNFYFGNFFTNDNQLSSNQNQQLSLGDALFDAAGNANYEFPASLGYDQQEQHDILEPPPPPPSTAFSSVGHHSPYMENNENASFHQHQQYQQPHQQQQQQHLTPTLPPLPPRSMLQRSKVRVNLAEAATNKERKNASGLRGSPSINSIEGGHESAIYESNSMSNSESGSQPHSQSQTPKSASRLSSRSNLGSFSLEEVAQTPQTRVRTRANSRLQRASNKPTPGPVGNEPSTSKQDDASPNLTASTKTPTVTTRSKSGRKTLEPQELMELVHIDLPQQSARSKSRAKNKGKDGKKVHECPLCKMAFQRPEHVKRHMISHSSSRPFECPEPNCSKRFNRKDNLNQHLRNIHKREP